MVQDWEEQGCPGTRSTTSCVLDEIKHQTVVSGVDSRTDLITSTLHPTPYLYSAAMSRQITQPLNQVRLTNVAVVRLSRHGHRFEVACYRNKIVNWRQGTETDLTEVLQTERVFTNVSKGQFASTKIIKQCFDTSDEEVVCRFILDKGAVQVSDQERAAQLESTMREVASMVAEKCVDGNSGRPYTVTQIRDAMKGAGYMVHPTRNIKQQFLDCVRLIKKKGVLDIERAKMELCLTLLASGGGDDDVSSRRRKALDLLTAEGISRGDVTPATGDDDSKVIFKSDPSKYRRLEEIAKDESVGGRLDITRQCVTESGDVALGSELERRAMAQQKYDEADDEHDVGPDSDSKVEEEDGAGRAMEDLASRVQANLRVDDSDNDDENFSRPTANSRKAQKAAKKKSKKAKRREKEEAAERDERVSAEKERQKRRAERLGLDDEPSCTRINGGSQQQPSGGGEGSKSCTTCGGSFTPAEYRAHFRSEWHGYNVKLKLRGVPPVSEEEFRVVDMDAFFD